MSGQTLVIGFGVTGANAARYLLGDRTDPADLTVIDRSSKAIEQAADLGARTILGDGTNRHVLGQAVPGQIRRVIVAVVPDEAAVLTTMLARELWPAATIVTAVRNDVHITVVRRHGADYAVTTSESAGTALAHALNEQHEPVTSPWTIDQRPVQQSEIGRPLHECIPTAVGILRGDQRHWGPEAAGLRLVEGDRIVFLRTHDADTPH
jgi:voltage-gated potassium channel